jgi:putative phosphoesterase
MEVKIAVVSDTHGERNSLFRVIEETGPFDIIIHCGDGLRDICAADIPGNTMVLMVKGNTDTSPHCDADDILFESILQQKIMITHGHLFNVKTGYTGMLSVAKAAQAGFIIFGHTHKQFFQDGEPGLFNPGNLSGGYYGIIYANNDRWIFEHRKIKQG